MNGLKWVARATVVALLAVNLHPFPLQGQGGTREFEQVHLGMAVRLVLPTGPAADSAAAEVFERIASYEQILSDWRPTSELRRISSAPRLTWQPLSAPLTAVLTTAFELARASNGAFDPTVGPLTALWRQSRDRGTAISDSARALARSRVGWWWVDLDTARQRIRFARDSMRLDLGAIAKGWILDRSAELLRQRGIDSYLIEAGGDLIVGAAPPGASAWHIAVSTDRGDSVMALVHQAVSTSGPGAQSIVTDGVRHSHVIDLTSGQGTVSPLQVSVIGPRAELTDALATTLTLVPRSRWPDLTARFGVRLVATSQD